MDLSATCSRRLTLKLRFKGWYALNSRLPHILWLADPPTAHVLYHL